MADVLTVRDFGEKFYYWLRKLRTQMAEASASQLAPLSSAEDIPEIQYRGAVVNLPSGVDMDAVAALLHALQSL